MPADTSSVLDARAKGWVTPLEFARFARVHQWSKNALVFVPLVLGQAYFDIAAIEAATLAFVALSLLASGTYVFNDILDADADRDHPTKRRRLVASGRLTPSAAGAFGTALAAGGLILACLVGKAFVALTVLYACVSLAYSLRIKRVPMTDVLTVGLLFTLRIAAGAEAAGLQHSSWLLSFSSLFFTSLAFAKRHAEVHGAHIEGREIKGRGYRPSDWPLTLACGISSLFAALVVLSLYLSEEAARLGVYARPEALWATPVVLAAWSLRIWHLAHRGDLVGDPVSFALRDRSSLGMGAIVLAIYATALCA